jgi:hypothetical protein
MHSAARGNMQVGRALGLVVALVALLLSLPGVRAVRAGEPDMTPVGRDDFDRHTGSDLFAVQGSPSEAQDPAACGDPAKREPVKPVVRIALPPTDGDSEGVILLNNRGYNYGSAPAPDDAHWQQIERELLEPARP